MQNCSTYDSLVKQHTTFVLISNHTGISSNQVDVQAAKAAIVNN